MPWVRLPQIVIIIATIFYSALGNHKKTQNLCNDDKD